MPRRIPTNTPLQALVTLNDPVFHQAAEALAARMQREAPPAPGDRLDNQLNFGARLVLSRDLAAAELKVLRRLHRQGRDDGGGQRPVQPRCRADTVTRCRTLPFLIIARLTADTRRHFWAGAWAGWARSS